MHNQPRNSQLSPTDDPYVESDYHNAQIAAAGQVREARAPSCAAGGGGRAAVGRVLATGPRTSPPPRALAPACRPPRAQGGPGAKKIAKAKEKGDADEWGDDMLGDDLLPM